MSWPRTALLLLAGGLLASPVAASPLPDALDVLPGTHSVPSTHRVPSTDCVPSTERAGFEAVPVASGIALASAEPQGSSAHDAVPEAVRPEGPAPGEGEPGDAAPAAADAAAVDAAAPEVPGVPREALFRFVLAKVLSSEGDLGAAGAAFQDALDLAPDEPYLRLEYASHLIQLAGTTRGGRRDALLQEARQQAERARDLVRGRAGDEPAVWSTLAEVYYDLARNDPTLRDDAREAMERVVEADPDDLESALTLGQLYLSDGEAEKAVALFERVAERTSGNRFVYSLLGEALMRTGRSAEAEQVLGRLLALDPSSRQVRLGLAGLLSERGAHGAALEVLEEAPPGLRAQPDVQRRMALEMLSAGRLEEARERLDELHAAEPDDPQAMAARVLVLAAQGAWDELDRTVADLAPTDSGRRELAVLLQQQGELEAAERLLRETLALLEPAERDSAEQRTAAAVRLHLADVLTARGQAAAAAELVEPVVRNANPDQQRSLLVAYLGMLARAGRSGEALDRLEEEDRRLRNDPSMRALKVELLLGAGREAEARRLLERLAETPELRVPAARAALGEQRYDLAIPILETVVAQPDPPHDALFLLASSYERTGRLDRAEEVFRRLLERAPAHHPALNYLGYMWAERGENLDEALELIRRAVSLEPNDGSYLDSLGWVHYQLGEYETALKYLQRAVRRAPREATIHEHLGDVLAALGRAEAAQREYRRALDLTGSANAEQTAVLERKLQDLGPPGADGP